MIIFDMDGTLLNSKGIIPENSKEILKRLKQAGKTIVIATGRCLKHCENYFTEDFADYILASNGALWYRINDKQILKQNILNRKSCIEALESYSNSITKIYVLDDDVHGFEDVNSAINYINKNSNILCVSFHLNNYQECAKTVETLNKNYEDLYIQLMQDSFDKYQWIDIMSKGNNKGNNIRTFTEYCNINFNDTICFGDGLNDIEMFKNVKTAVAMKNALPELKSLATHITDTNDNDGIYKFLDNYFFDKKEQGE